MSISIESINHFWFGEIKAGQVVPSQKKRWFSVDPLWDQEIRHHFEDTLLQAASGQLDEWQQSPAGALALIILLDQFSRNIYRGSSQAFAFDEKALEVAKCGVDAGVDKSLWPVQRSFFYLPFEHSESIKEQQRSVALFESLYQFVDPEFKEQFSSSLDYAREHHDLIAQFGRFPHRNAVLGRESRAEEIAFLKRDGRAYGQS